MLIIDVFVSEDLLIEICVFFVVRNGWVFGGWGIVVFVGIFDWVGEFMDDFVFVYRDI